MKIGDEVYVHGYVDEIRNDVIIIRNDGGYFGTVPSEMLYYEEDERGYGTMNSADTPQTDLLVKSPRKSRDSHEKDTPQTDCTIQKLTEFQERLGVVADSDRRRMHTDCGWGEASE